MSEIVQYVYADTSVFGGAFDLEFSKASLLFLEQVKSGRFHLILSPIVEKELLVAPTKVGNLYQTISAYGEMLPLNEKTLRLQEAYLNAGIVTKKWAADALHVAHATVHNCRMIISWIFGTLSIMIRLPFIMPSIFEKDTVSSEYTVPWR